MRSPQVILLWILNRLKFKNMENNLSSTGNAGAIFLK